MRFYVYGTYNLIRMRPARRTLKQVDARTHEALGRLYRMCKNIRTLHNFDPPATDDEVHASALQYVRKISGSSKPSHANAEAFDRAVEEVAAATQRLLEGLTTSAPPKNREVEAAKRQARAAARFA
jgi:hypothetical protein